MTPVAWIAAALAACGGALLAYPLAGALPARVAGGVLCAGALALLVLERAKMQRAVRRYRRWAREAGADESVPRLPFPLASLARAAEERATERVAATNAKVVEARRARVDLKELENEHVVLSALVQDLADGVLLIDPSGRPTLANAAARRVLGLQPDAPLQADVRGLSLRPALARVVEEGVLGRTRESRRSRDVDASDSAEHLVLRVVFQEVRSPGASEDEASLAVVMRDVTREVELNRMKSDFASSVSHELKTPLSSMRAFLEMILDGDIQGETEQRAHLQMVKDETERLAHLIQNLLNLARLEAGVTKLAREPVSMNALLEHLREVMAPLAAARGQTLVFEVSPFLPDVTGDKNMLEQACMNLVSNAVKYTPEGGNVRVKAQLSGNEVELLVKDTGVGIPEKAIDLVFQKFTRIENNSGLKATGTGLGLPLAKFVAEAHGGRITLASEVGKGSEFRLFLPARRGQESREEQLVGLEGISG